MPQAPCSRDRTPSTRPLRAHGCRHRSAYRTNRAGQVSSPDGTRSWGARPLPELKGRDLMVDQFGEVLGLATSTAP
jgi:hypothetical protein